MPVVGEPIVVGFNKRIKLLERLFSLIQPVPSDWLGASHSRIADNTQECRDYSTLANSWRRALKWTDGLDHALSVMLASVVSTKTVGDQLWIKIMSPASCLGAKTPIFDPVDKTTRTVEDRCHLGRRFWVYTRKHDGKIGIAQALPPRKYKPQPMYEVTLASGRSFRVTGGHKIWNGSSYVALHTIAGALQESLPYPLQSISEHALKVHFEGARHCKKTTLSSQESCSLDSCLCDGLPHPRSRISPTPSLSVGGAPRRTLGSVGGPSGLSRSNNPLIPCDPLSNSNNLSQASSGAELKCGSSVDTFSLQSAAHLRSLHIWRQTFLGESTPVESLLLDLQRVFRSASLSQLLVCTELQTPKKHGTSLRTLLSSALGHSRQQSVPSLPAEPGASAGDERQCLFASEPSESVPDRCSGIYQSQRTCGPLSTSRLLDPNDLDSLDALETSVETRKELDTSILPKTDQVVKVKYVGIKPYYDFVVPETNNYWAVGLFHHNTGKTTLAEGLAVCKEFVEAVDTMTGLISGYQADNEGSQNFGLVSRVNNKTLIVKDGDTILTDPALPKILSQFRAFYDRNLRTRYGNKMSADHEGINTTVILCGTSSLHKLDSSELGERFLDCKIMERIDPDLEDEILWRKCNQAERSVSMESNGQLTSQHLPELAQAMKLTGGYVRWLRENAITLLSQATMGESHLRTCVTLAKFVAYMRARPSVRQEETAERELASRLVSQLTRLAKCLAVVLNHKTVDEQVMERVKRVALDTSQGQVLRLSEQLHATEREGMQASVLAMATGIQDDKCRKLLRFLRHIEAVEHYQPKSMKGIKPRPRWRLTARMQQLYSEVMDNENEKEA